MATGRAQTRHRGSEWAPIYMLIVMLIAAIIVIKLVKPAFQQAQAAAAENIQGAEAAARALSLVFLIPRAEKILKKP